MPVVKALSMVNNVANICSAKIDCKIDTKKQRNHKVEHKMRSLQHKKRSQKSWEAMSDATDEVMDAMQGEYEHCVSCIKKKC